MFTYETLTNLVEDALESKVSIDEKIMSKKAARKLRKQKAAAQKAKQQAAQQQATKQTEPEETKEKPQKEELIIDDKKLPAVIPQQTEYSEAFKQLRQMLEDMTKKYFDMIQKAKDIWKQAGKDQPVPDETYKIFIDVISGLHQDIENFVNNVYPKYMNDMCDAEIDNIEEDIRLKQEFLQKFNKMVLGLKPEQIQQQTGTDLQIQNTEVTTTGSTALTVPGSTAVATLDDIVQQQKKAKTPTDNRRRKNQIISYEDWEKQGKSLWKMMDAIKKLWGLLSKIPFGEFLKTGGKFITDNLWAAFTSPLAGDIIKTLMYSNPLTAMIYNGDFGKLNFSALKKPPRQKDNNKNVKISYDKNGLPKDLKNANKNDLIREFFTNKSFIKLINEMYNHVDVELNDKAQLKKLSQHLMSLCKSKNSTRDQIISVYTQLIKLVDKITLYLGWDEKTLKSMFNKWFGEKGNTQKEEKKIKQKIKKQNKKPEQLNLNTEQIKNLSDQEKAELRAALGIKQESYYDTSNLMRLVECAEA